MNELINYNNKKNQSMKNQLEIHLYEEIKNSYFYCLPSNGLFLSKRLLEI